MPGLPATLSEDEEKLEYLKKKSVSLTLNGWTRCFGARHASIQERADGQVRTFGVYLTPEQGCRTDEFEKLGTYYDKIEVPVTLNDGSSEETQTTAMVYRMTEQAV